MTFDQIATHLLRNGAFLVWLAYFVVTFRHPGPTHLRDVVTVAIVVLFTAAQAFRGAFFPSDTRLEFTIVSTVALLAGVALLTSPRR